MFDPGDVLLHQGEPIRRVGYVESGELLMLLTTAGGEEHACGLRGEGSLVGHEGLRGQPARLDARLISRAVVHSCDVAEFFEWARGATERMEAVVSCLVDESARAAIERQFVIGPAAHRVARFLRERETNPLMSIWRHTPLHAIAGLLAMRPETLSRALRSLQREGLVEHGREIKVRNLAGLSKKLGESA